MKKIPIPHKEYNRRQVAFMISIYFVTWVEKKIRRKAKRNELAEHYINDCAKYFARRYSILDQDSRHR